MSTTMTIRLDDELKEQLDRLAAATQRSKSFLASEAIREFIELNEWQVREIQQALKEADAGEFASDGEAKQTCQVVATCANVSSVCGAIDRQCPARAAGSDLVLDRIRPGEQAPELPALLQQVSVPF
mgnify:FL=1|jgi:predicted transcriptional regulator|tara:strand:+ start:12068 stop:12448 length:381 start_codon:yes stop_codon:yes gene_type:complete